MLLVKPRRGERPRLDRISQLLKELGIYTDARAAAMLVFMDDRTPNRFSSLRDAGAPISAAARTSHVFDEIADRLQLSRRLDREQRDYVFVQLREVGLLDICWVLPRHEVERQGKLVEYGFHDPKSPNNAYVATDDARQLILMTSTSAWPRALRRWLEADQQRRLRLAQHAATSAVASASGSGARHSALIRACAEGLLGTVAKTFVVVFIDEADGQRIAGKWDAKLDRLGLKPDLDSLWPDAILVDPGRKALWFIDAVKTDGEIDELRAQQLRGWSSSRGYEAAGMTTAYETWRSVARRQGAHKNLAVGTTLWVAEDGGKIFSVAALVPP